MLQDSRIIALIHTYCPREVLQNWPSDVPPAGLLALLFAEAPQIHDWARKQSLHCQVQPMPAENFLSGHTDLLKMVSESLVSSRPLSDCFGGEYKFTSLQEQSSVWASYVTLIRFAPPKFLSENETGVDIRHVIVGHLHNTEHQFMDVLKSFILVLRRIGTKMWENKSSEYAHVVFNSIKDNSRYADVLCAVPHDDGLLRWIELYTASVVSLPVFPDIAASILQFLCEELQHERFKMARPTAMSIATRVLSAVFGSEKKDQALQKELPFHLLGVHSAVFVNVAFGRNYDAELWAEARRHAKRLLKHAMLTDAKRVAALVTSLSSPTKVDSEHLQTKSVIHELVWKKVYEGIVGNDSDAIALLLSVLSKVAHMDELKPAAFEDLLRKAQLPTNPPALAAVNSALAVFRNGFRDVLTRYTDLSIATAALDLLRQENAIHHIVTLMFSPVEALQEAAQGLVGLAYDIDGRLDCFRALLEHHPDATFQAITDVLQVYTAYAPAVPEACSLSQALARCLTDVLECLCSSPDGLLLQPRYLAAAGAALAERVPRWWQLMTEALCVVFARTPAWARFFENEEMVLWMRDALIFGRDLLAHRRVLEAGAVAGAQTHGKDGKDGKDKDKDKDKDGKAARRAARAVGRQMVDDLQQVLFELTKWLRLTDEELLHQSFALLETLLDGFRAAETRPRAETLARIAKHIEDARTPDPNRLRSRLDGARVGRLEEAVARFEDEDDEVEIVEPPPKPKEHEKREIQIQKREPRHILKTSDKDKFKPVDKKKPTITNYFGKKRADEDVRSTSSSSTLVSTSSSRTAGPSRPSSRPLIKDEGAKARAAPPPAKPVESSSSEDEASSDDEKGGLASLSKLQRDLPPKKPQERRQIKMIDIPMGHHPKMARLQQARKHEDARRAHLRLKPDLSSLYRTLLVWNYDHNGPTPPGDSGRRLSSVPGRFRDYAHFRSVFEPMLFLELWNQLMESKEQPLESYECRIMNRQYTDEYIDLDVTIEGNPPREWALAETDIVLFTNPGTKARMLGKAQSYRNSHLGVSATIRYMPAGGDPGLHVGTCWGVAKVLSLTTLVREYAALMSLQYYDLLDIVLHGQLPRVPKVDKDEVQRVMKSYKVNEPQANAILKSLDTEGFALIQGPPGTGKTSTICGLVQLYLARRSRIISRPGDRELPKKILLCAPSNAAIDEVANRLKDGVSGAGHRAERPKVVRIGAAKAMSSSVREVSLEYLMDEKLNSHPELQNSKEAGSELARIRAGLDSVRRQRQEKYDEMEALHDNGAKTQTLREDIQKLNRQKAMLSHQFDKAKDKQKSDHRTLDATRRRFRNEVLQEADVICSTLSASAYEYLEPFDFELVIIDEAAQAIELSSLIPMKYRCKTCIMVGDPQQLPPTVKSQEACRLGYDQSLFVRLQKSQPGAVHLLSIQYRMHPDISQLPSNLFYDGRLQDGPDMAEKTIRPWHMHEKFGTYRFFNVESGFETTAPGAGHSIVNRTEVQVAVALFNRLTKDFPTASLDFKIGVISMYRGQIVELRRAFQQRFGEEALSTVDFNTVDGFQGQEKDIIILSCVRAGPGLQTVGFLRDVRRMNVALTRSKASLFILGHAPTLERSDETWRRIVENARARQCLVQADVGFFTAPVSKTAAAMPVRPKALKPPSKPAPPIPELMTPQEYKAKTKALSASASNVDVSMPDVQPEVTATSTAASTSEEAHTGQKRRADGPPTEEAGASGPLPPRGGPAKPRPKPPPVKRAKQAPSLFIPKKR
ncbi:SEN1 N terminal-domain-containing protein [Epithele typhae]|uniref:SEN1 N terminal-domain-containing protein n=1 Tax=Epithele typhae TaxID=378194 RepID=UPI002007B312|nr:SEN1 N terminal-domain-containing protein [Epithele typhae]KAH9922778.1 SEN1 N terminal-domain-containing protein [Epithele typhae]